MRHIYTNLLRAGIIPALLLMTAAACSEWTKVESVGIRETMPWDAAPQEWADYQARVRSYKSRSHTLSYIRFANSPSGVQNEKGSLRSLPDSLDIVSLTNGVNFSEYDSEDMARMRAVAIRVICQADLASSEDVAATLDATVAAVDRHGLDGYSFTASSHEDASAAVARLSSAKSDSRILVFEGNPSLIAEDDIAKIDLFVLATETLENPYSLRNAVTDALEAGVPREKMLLAASLKGVYYSSDNAELPVLEAMADNAVTYGPMAGLAVYDVESDYYHYEGNWSSLRAVICRLNQ